MPADSKQPDSRPLTEGEIELARKVFGDKIDYTKVAIKGAPDFMPRPATPLGQIHMPSFEYRADYSKAKSEEQSRFMHEMTHVWQYQSGRSVLGGAALEFIKNKGNYEEAYSLPKPEDIKDFNALGIEQQGKFIGNFYSTNSFGKEGLYRKALETAGFTVSPEMVINREPPYPGFLESNKIGGMLVRGEFSNPELDKQYPNFGAKSREEVLHDPKFQAAIDQYKSTMFKAHFQGSFYAIEDAANAQLLDALDVSLKAHKMGHPGMDVDIAKNMQTYIERDIAANLSTEAPKDHPSGLPREPQAATRGSNHKK